MSLPSPTATPAAFSRTETGVWTLDVKMTGLPAKLSPSALRRYESCPRQFYWADIERRSRGGDASPLLMPGNAVHDALDRFFGLPEEARTLEVLHRVLRWVWPLHRDDSLFHSRDEEREWGLRGLKLLDSFATTFGLSGAPLAREQWVGVDICGTNLYTKLDRIDYGGDEGLVDVLDYKTGKRGNLEQLRADPAAMLAIVAVEGALKRRVRAVRYLYLKTASEVTWLVTDDDRASARARLTRLLHEIRDDHEFAPTPGRLCRWCPFALTCPARGRVALEEIVVDPETPF